MAAGSHTLETHPQTDSLAFVTMLFPHLYQATPLQPEPQWPPKAMFTPHLRDLHGFTGFGD
jgi:hypothetical protein